MEIDMGKTTIELRSPNLKNNLVLCFGRVPFVGECVKLPTTDCLFMVTHVIHHPRAIDDDSEGVVAVVSCVKTDRIEGNEYKAETDLSDYEKAQMHMNRPDQNQITLPGGHVIEYED